MNFIKSQNYLTIVSGLILLCGFIASAVLDMLILETAGDYTEILYHPYPAIVFYTSFIVSLCISFRVMLDKEIAFHLLFINMTWCVAGCLLFVIYSLLLIPSFF